MATKSLAYPEEHIVAFRFSGRPYRFMGTLEYCREQMEAYGIDCQTCKPVAIDAVCALCQE